VSGLFAAGLILLALAALADFAGGRLLRTWPLYLAGAAGSACLAVLGGFALAGRTVQLDVAGWLGDPVPGQQAAALAADRLSGMFLALTFGAAMPVSFAFASWAARAQCVRRGLGASYALALGAVAVIMTARDAFTALFGWETLTLAFYLLAGAERNRPGRSAAAQVTFAFGKVSDDGSGPPDRADPGGGEAAAHLRYASDVMEVVETYVYRPALGFFMRSSRPPSACSPVGWTPTCCTCSSR